MKYANPKKKEQKNYRKLLINNYLIIFYCTSLYLKKATKRYKYLIINTNFKYLYITYCVKVYQKIPHKYQL